MAVKSNSTQKRRRAFVFFKLFFFAFFLISGLFLAKLFFLDIPLLTVQNPKLTPFMELKNHHKPLAWTRFQAIPNALKTMVIASEDSRFYEHHGVDWIEFRHVLEESEKRGHYVRGASTITMQLARNLFLSPDKNLVRKMVEILAALRMETVLSKNRILELYLNVVEWGKGVYGIKAAAKHYFQTTPEKLSSHQAAFLAAILPNPSKWGRWPPSSMIAGRMGLIKRRAGY